MSVFIAAYSKWYEDGYGRANGYIKVIGAGSDSDSAKRVCRDTFDEDRRQDANIQWVDKFEGYGEPDLPDSATNIEYGAWRGETAFVVFEVPLITVMGESNGS